MEAPPIDLDEELSFGVQLIVIVDQEMKQLKSNVIVLIKVLCKNHLIEEMTRETEIFMRNHYPFLFECSMWKFWGQNFYKEGRNVIPVILLLG